ncbi:MAG: GTP cyclohydrolase [Acidobacteriota bacterium]
MIIRLGQRHLKTKFGTFLEMLYYDGQKESIALVMGDVENSDNVLCRVHSSCISAHVFNSIECDCREQMEISQALIENNQQGVIIWLDQEGKSNGHLALLHSANLKATGLSQTEAYLRLGFQADARNYQRAAEILEDLKVRSIVLLTNNRDKIETFANVGIKVVDTKAVHLSTEENRGF